MKKKYYVWIISKKNANFKLLVFLKKQLRCSNKQIKKALDKGLCLVDNKIERFGSTVLHQKAQVKLNVLWKKNIEEKKISSIKILYEDEYFIAIDKPSNFICTDQNIHKFFSKNFTLIHRLDKETTGILLISKNKKFKDEMIGLFKNHKITKKYFALIDGFLNQKEMKIETYIKKIKSYDGQTIYGTSKKGKYALTYLKIKKRFKDKTLVELMPITGRTHQLRVHMKQISHPILGDFLYSKKFYNTQFISRLMLHCYQIEFVHPITYKEIIITSKPSQEFFS